MVVVPVLSVVAVGALVLTFRMRADYAMAGWN